MAQQQSNDGRKVHYPCNADHSLAHHNNGSILAMRVPAPLILLPRSRSTAILPFQLGNGDRIMSMATESCQFVPQMRHHLTEGKAQSPGQLD